MNRRGQLGGIVFFVAMVIVLILIVPIFLKVATSILGTTATQLSQVQGNNQSSDQVTYVKNQITGTFDWFVMALVFINMLVLFISAFLVDIHPAFLILYIIGAFVLVITMPYALSSAEKVYSMSTFSSGSDNVIQYIPMTEFLFNNFGVFIVGVIFLTGIIMYAKIRFSSATGSGGGY